MQKILIIKDNEYILGHSTTLGKYLKVHPESIRRWVRKYKNEDGIVEDHEEIIKNGYKVVLNPTIL